jgi:hypothetical protein
LRKHRLFPLSYYMQIQEEYKERSRSRFLWSFYTQKDLPLAVQHPDIPLE